MLEGLNRVDASAVTLNQAEKSSGKLVQIGELMNGLQHVQVEELAAILPRIMDLATISEDKPAAVVDKIVRSS